MEPPLDINEIIDHLNIYFGYYNLEDPSLKDEIWHKLHIGLTKAKDILGKISLKGLWLPTSNKILLDVDLPNSKKKWTTAHEIIHKLLPTHRIILLGDTAETLDPEYHDMMESEANYGASSLIFLGEVFTEEAHSYSPSFKSIQDLSKRYRNSLTTTLRRYVEYGYLEPICGLISKPLWDLTSNGSCRYYFKSESFITQFANVKKEELLEIRSGSGCLDRGWRFISGVLPLFPLSCIGHTLPITEINLIRG